MKTVKMTIDKMDLAFLPKGKVDEGRLDATSEAEIATQQSIDEAVALQNAAKFARRERKRLGLSQAVTMKQI
ncbi:MAG: hypothetical protein PHG00_04345 [Methylococcales bacterium]|nr:hypothetical protein [Methylococcales bacterium]